MAKSECISRVIECERRWAIFDGALRVVSEASGGQVPDWLLLVDELAQPIRDEFDALAQIVRGARK